MEKNSQPFNERDENVQQNENVQKNVPSEEKKKNHRTKLFDLIVTNEICCYAAKP